MGTLRKAVFAAATAGALVTAARAAAADATGIQNGGGEHFPAILQMDTAGNNVLEPNETVAMVPTWGNTFYQTLSGTGTLSAFTGPAGPTYTIVDGHAAYVLPPGHASCLSTGNCYALRVSAAIRPVTHWDATVTETLLGWPVAFTLHIGGSFTDVPAAGPFSRFVETLLHRGVTTGCGGTAYCPSASTTREQMPVFVLVALEGPAYVAPACGTTPMFADVPVSSPFCRWIEELARRGVTSGCAAGLYCPSAAVTRDQMAVFGLRALEPSLSPPACGAPMFADVPPSNPFCRWIEELARRGVVSGCGGGNYCPESAVTREEMAVFLTGTFGLSLYCSECWIESAQQRDARAFALGSPTSRSLPARGRP